MAKGKGEGLIACTSSTVLRLHPVVFRIRKGEDRSCLPSPLKNE